jgi:MSHA biogenesis protein MshK
MLVESSEQAPPDAILAAAGPLDGLKLQAVVFNGPKSSMVINGRSLRVGDEIDGVKIVEVQPNEVIVEKEGLKHTLRME